MPKPAHDLVHRAKDHSVRHSGPIDHNDRQAQSAGGDQFGLGPNAASVFGHNMGDAMLTHQGFVLCRLKRATGDNYRGLGQRRNRFGFIDQPQQIMVLGRGGKEVEVLFANRKKHPCWSRRQGRGCGLERGHMGPVITHARLPRGPLQGTQRHARLCTGSYGVVAHLRGKGMSGVNHMGHSFAANVIDKPCDSTKPAQPLGQRLRHRARGTASIGKDGLTPGHRMRGEVPRQLRGVRGAAEKKDVLHV